jgi:hypothetical protein
MSTIKKIVGVGYDLQDRAIPQTQPHTPAARRPQRKQTTWMWSALEFCFCLVYAPLGRSCERCACCCLSWHAACHAPDEKNAFQPHACTTTSHVLHAHINAWAMGMTVCLGCSRILRRKTRLPPLSQLSHCYDQQNTHKQTHSTQRKTNTLVHTRTHMHITRSRTSSLHTATLVQTRQS